MMGCPEVVDVEVTIGIPQSRDAVGVFLHHPDPDGRVEAETTVFTNGGEYTTYPQGPIPPQAAGFVSVKGTNLYVSIGSMYIIAPLTVKHEEIARIEKAVVYLTDAPFDPADTTEKTWLAVHLPLSLAGEGDEL
ncbi:hypothetical protein SEA_KRADAL_148 [Streptomyces phage Kradal]|nr:hypothetical protein SEA_KRADAL_148 [Streptomyces phage Kradal]